MVKPAPAQSLTLSAAFLTVTTDQPRPLSHGRHRSPCLCLRSWSRTPVAPVLSALFRVHPQKSRREMRPFPLLPHAPRRRRNHSHARHPTTAAVGDKTASQFTTSRLFFLPSRAAKQNPRPPLHQSQIPSRWWLWTATDHFLDPRSHPLTTVGGGGGDEPTAYVRYAMLRSPQPYHFSCSRSKSAQRFPVSL